LQHPDLCKIPRIKRFKKPTTSTTVQNKLNKCICWKDLLSSEETLYITSRCGVYNFLYHTLMFINCRKLLLKTETCFKCVWVCVCECLKFIPLCYIILQLTYASPSTTTNFISLVNTCYTFQSYWPSSGVRYIIFKTGNKMHIYIYIYVKFVRSHKLCKSWRVWQYVVARHMENTITGQQQKL
jgi:hypothetical protein